MKRKRLLTGGLAFAMTGVMLMSSGCGVMGSNNIKKLADGVSNLVGEIAEDKGNDDNGGKGDPDSSLNPVTDNIDVQDTITESKGINVKYNQDLICIGREDRIDLQLNFDIKELDYDLDKLFKVCQDPEGKAELICATDWDEEKQVVTVLPPYSGPALLDADGVDTRGLSGSYFAYQADKSWGNLQQYYLFLQTDLQTGKPLAEPLVTVIRLVPEITQIPNLTFSPTEDGKARFIWEPVEGAESYLFVKVLKYDYPESEMYGYVDAQVCGRTAECEWTCAVTPNTMRPSSRWEQMFMDSPLFMNRIFSTYIQSEDDKLDDDFQEIEVNDYGDYYYGIIAVNSEGASCVSNLFNENQLSHMLPHTRANQANRADGSSANSYDSVMDLPATTNIVMCDGTIAQRVINYDFENALWEEEEDFVQIRANIDKTLFCHGVRVPKSESKEAMLAEMKAITQRQEEMKNRAGNVDITITFEEPEVPDPENQPQLIEPIRPQLPESDVDKITANSELSEYLAGMMLNREDVIDLSGFAEARDMQVVQDAILEAKTQNPLILGLRNVTMDKQGQLHPEYDDDKTTFLKKQEEIKDKVEEIVNQIITPGMSDLEKEFAINQYLCDHAEYDFDALDNAAKNNYTSVDPKYNDSFTPYGILVKKIGVCAGYAGSFKLLADASGLDCIVVTGFLDGNLSHAWNKVQIDGQWVILDSTNNDNERFPNTLLNLSNRTSQATLVEDDKYLLDDYLDKYVATTDEKEYYRVTGQYYNMTEIAGQLNRHMASSENPILLRTEITLDDTGFQALARESSKNITERYTGYYWLGLVRLEK